MTVKPKLYYTGEKITLSKGDLEVKMGAITLESDQYEILEDSYVNNLKKGTAKVTIKGKGEYGGTKTISFKINDFMNTIKIQDKNIKVYKVKP